MKNPTAWLLSLMMFLGAACSSSSSGGTGGGTGQATGGAGGHAANGGSGTGGAAGAGGSPATGGAGGAVATGGAGGAAACAPCFLSILDRISCDPGATATCIQQTSRTINSDGTITSVENKCYSDGSKNLQTDTYASADAGSAGFRSGEVQVFKPGGGACATAEISGTSTASQQSVTEVIKDGSGNLLATLHITETLVDGGAPVETTTITCPGQAAQPLGTCPSTSTSSAVCTPGTCP